jgi:hypothetical protein
LYGKDISFPNIKRYAAAMNRAAISAFLTEFELPGFFIQKIIAMLDIA